MNWMIDLCSILILNSIQGMVFGLILCIWYRISKTEQCLLLNYQALKWQAMSYLIPVAYILNRTFFYNGYVFSRIGWSRLMAGILCTVWWIGTLIFVGKYLQKCRWMWKIVCDGHAVSADIEEYLLRIKQEMGYKKRISAWRKSAKWKSWVFVVMCLSLCVCFPVSVLAHRFISLETPNNSGMGKKYKKIVRVYV